MTIDDAGQFGYEGTTNGTIGGVPASFTTKVTVHWSGALQGLARSSAITSPRVASG